MKKDYLALWSILGCAFLIFFGLSTCDGGLSLCGMELKRSKMADWLLHKPDNPWMLDTIPQAAPIDTPAVAQPAPIDTVPKTILFIGDSMLEGLSPRLAAYCDASGHKLYTVIWYSSTSQTWGKCSLAKQYIDQLHPDYIFICLGANELFVRDIAEKRDQYVKNILASFGDIPYLWIGPPNWKPDTGINDLIAANAPKGNFFLTNGMKFHRKKDGAHPTSESAIQWMDSIVRWMPEHSSHPILLNTPEKKTSRPVRVFLHQPGDKP